MGTGATIKLMWILKGAVHMLHAMANGNAKRATNCREVMIDRRSKSTAVLDEQVVTIAAMNPTLTSELARWWDPLEEDAKRGGGQVAPEDIEIEATKDVKSSYGGHRVDSDTSEVLGGQQNDSPELPQDCLRELKAAGLKRG